MKEKGDIGLLFMLAAFAAVIIAGFINDHFSKPPIHTTTQEKEARP